MQDEICAAIAQQKRISFLYKGTRREVEPHILGYDGDGDLTLSAWQISGGSGLGWRDFHVSKLSGLAVGILSFDVTRPGYNRNDKTLDRIVCRV